MEEDAMKPQKEKKPRQLTLKQLRWVEEYLKSGNATDAVRKAYPNHKSEGAMRHTGFENVTNPNIAKYIKESLERTDITLDELLIELKNIVKGDETSEKNKAIRTFLEIMGVIGKSSITVNTAIAPFQVVSQKEIDILHEDDSEDWKLNLHSSQIP